MKTIKKLQSLATYILTLVLVFGPQAAFAQTKLINPLGDNVTDFKTVFTTILEKAILPFAVMIAIVFIVWAGFGFVMAQGNKDKLDIAKKRLVYTLIGVAIVVGAKIILDLLLNTVNDITNVPIN